MTAQFVRIKIKKNLQSWLTDLLGSFHSTKASPDELLGELFQDVQLRSVYPDSITFVDLVPAAKMRKIFRIYERQRLNHNFNLHNFIKEHFRDYLSSPDDYKTNPNHTIEQHVNELWNVLTHENYSDTGSLLALPHPYVVPGGRYVTGFYWDSYFIMLGLAASKRYDLLEGMIKNFAYLIRKYGYIPNGNRSYYLGRSQPPLFSYCVKLLAEKRGKRVLVKYLPYMLTEYKFWMKGSKQLHELAPAYHRVVRLPDGSLMNRYYDNKRTPRPEGYKEDIEIAHQAFGRAPSQVYLDVRAAAESGWDFSSRWCADGQNLVTIHTTDLLPVDLNCLLYDMEKTLAHCYRVTKQRNLATLYTKKAEERAAAITNYCWSKKDGYFMDYDFVAAKTTSWLSLAGTFPLYVGIASKQQAEAVVRVLKKQFLKPGGLVTTPYTTGQQWDAPNGWSALQWVAIVGLRKYGYDDLANEIKTRWIATNEAVYKAKGKLVEKYDVCDLSKPAGGGEYVLQDGFGMTNGVLMALLADDDVAAAR